MGVRGIGNLGYIIINIDERRHKPTTMNSWVSILPSHASSFSNGHPTSPTVTPRSVPRSMARMSRSLHFSRSHTTADRTLSCAAAKNSLAIPWPVDM